MPNLVGKITASLIEKDQLISEGLVDKINTNVKPPSPVSFDDVYIRAMYIISDRVNSFGGRFPADEHARLSELLIDSPVLIGHRKDSLPIARNFHAEMVKRKNSNWIKVYFYWLRNADKGEDLRKNIDGGIYKECSISFVFNFPECSICGSDIRECRHRPSVKYKTDTGEKKEAYFNYRQILKVLETSLVFRGSVQDTSITDELFFSKTDPAGSTEKRVRPQRTAARRLWDLNLLDDDRDYYVMPAYESLKVVLDRSNENIDLLKDSGEKLEGTVLSEYLAKSDLPEGDYALDCRLIGYRGKERQPVSELVKFLNSNNSSVRRIELKICDLIRCDDELTTEDAAAVRRKKLEEIFKSAGNYLVPAEKTGGGAISEWVNKRSTRYGLEIFGCGSSDRFLFTHKKLIPLQVSKREKTGGAFRYSLVGFVGKDPVPIAGTVTSRLDCGVGDVVEIEVYSVDRAADSMRLVHPQIVDCLGNFQGAEEIGLLPGTDSEPEVLSRYSVFELNSNSIVLAVCEDDKESRFAIHNFSPKLLETGRYFLADRIDSGVTGGGKPSGSGEVVRTVLKGATVLYELDGFLKGKFVIRPVVKNGAERLLFHKHKDCLQVGNS